MKEKNNSGLSDHPIIVSVGLVAGLIAIFVFVTGKNTLPEWFDNGELTPTKITNTPTKTSSPTQRPATNTPPSPTITIPVPTTTIPVPTKTLPPLRNIPITITDWGNDNIQDILPDIPLGEQYFNDIQFLIPEQNNKVSTRCGNELDWPTEIVIDTSPIMRSESIYLLINAGYTTGFANKNIGEIQVAYLDMPGLSYDLTLGQNIREWRFEVDGTVNSASSPQLAEIYRGITSHGDVGTIDMLTLNIPEDYHNGTITSIILKDLSQELDNSDNPCFHLIALTIKARN